MGQALYRKYRSKSLAELIGQEHITTALGNALKSGRISHAYLLTGPRGTGKTSVARILAHEINGLPYDDETHLDIIEIDAASNRRIDEIRDLRDKVATAPSHAKYKVYIIDEVHMLTKEAFNALLKTLEEPPAHVVFILATTEAHKLPETITSRTQRYSFRPVPSEQVVAHLKYIAKAEKIAIDDGALELIARHGEGSFRDSISLLDQASNMTDKITQTDIEHMLGLAPAEHIAGLLAALEGQDSAAIVTALSAIYAQGYEPAMVAVQLGESLRTAVLAGTLTGKLGSTAALSLLERLLDVPAARQPKQLLELILLQATLTADVQGTILSTTEEPRHPSPTPKETSTQIPDDKEESKAPAKAPTEKVTKEDVILTPGSEAGAGSAEESSHVQEEDPPVELRAGFSTPLHSAQDDTKESTATNITEVTELWQATLNEIKKQYNTLYGIARMATPELEGNKLTLHLKFAFHQKRLNEAKNRKIFGDVVARLSGQPIEIVCVVSDKPLPAATTKPDVSAISNIFGGAELLES